jgi:hypothetical protein
LIPLTEACLGHAEASADIGHRQFLVRMKGEVISLDRDESESVREPEA